MPGRDRSLTLFVPGLLNPAADVARLPASSWPALSSLEMLLSRGRWQHRVARGLEASLFALFGYCPEPGAELPCAAITRAIDGGAPDDGWWLRADPVHLHADHRSLIMLAHEQLHLTEQEASDLHSEVERAFADQGWHWEVRAPQRWYVRLPEPARIRTHGIAATLGHDILTRLPEGEDARLWRGYLNEVQMLLHAHPVNQSRVDRGQLPANSLWFWGGGRLPAAAQTSWSSVRSDDLLTRALAQHAGTAHAPLPAAEDGVQWLSDADNDLLVLHEAYPHAQLSDPYSWLEHLSALEQRWFVLLRDAVQQGVLGGLTLVTDDGRACRVSRGDLRRWWRRSRPCSAFLERDSPAHASKN